MSGINLALLGATPSISTASWIGLFGATSSNDRGQACATDSQGNSYVGGWRAVDYWELAKFNAAGVLQWQVNFPSTGSGKTWAVNAIAIDSSGNVYALGGGYIASDFSLVLVKYNSSGTVQWERSVFSSPSGNGKGITIDTSDNVYVVGFMGNDPFIAKYNTSGSIQWQRVATSGSSGTYNAVAVDTSGNVYAVGYYYYFGIAAYTPLVIKYDSSGSILWQEFLYTSNQMIATGAVLDSSGNLYISAYNNTDGWLIKVDSSGAVVFNSRLSATTTTSVCVDSSDNLYVCGYNDGGGTTLPYVQFAKYNSSGTIQWQRGMQDNTAYNSYSYGNSIKAFNSFIYICGYSSIADVSDFFISKTPTDGSLTGTYTVGGYSINYGATSRTTSSGTVTATATSFTNTTSTYTNNTVSETSSASSLTASVTTL
jgi:hypothetical protein